MDALIALNRRELALQAELDEIRTQKAALLATLAKPSPALLTPTKVKAAAAAPPPAPKKAPAAAAASDSESAGVARKITIRRKSTSSASTASSTASAPAPAAPSDDAVWKHWKAYKTAKKAQIHAAQPTWGSARVKTAIRNSYTLDHPAHAAALDQLEKAKEEAKEPREPSDWLLYVAAVREEIGGSYIDALKEAKKRRDAGDEAAPAKKSGK